MLSSQIDNIISVDLVTMLILCVKMSDEYLGLLIIAPEMVVASSPGPLSQLFNVAFSACNIEKLGEWPWR